MMAVGTSPTVRLRRLTAELRRLRKEAGLTGEDVARRLECDPSWVSRIESGRRTIRTRDLRQLLDVYGVHGDRREMLLDLARQARERGWWHPFGDIIPEWFQAYVGLETEAAELRWYEAELVPGLLQTADYYRAFMSTAPQADLPDEIDRKVELRLVRQQRLTAEQDPLRVWAILNEAVLRRQVGGPESMRAQLDHLVRLSEWQNITIQVLPFSAGPHPAMDGSFVIIEFPEPADPDVVYLESHTGSLYLEAATVIDRYNLVFNHLRAKALDTEQSRVMIVQAAKEL